MKNTIVSGFDDFDILNSQLSTCFWPRDRNERACHAVTSVKAGAIESVELALLAMPKPRRRLGAKSNGTSPELSALCWSKCWVVFEFSSRERLPRPPGGGAIAVANF